MSIKRNINIVLADDHVMFIRGLMTVFQEIDDLHVVAAVPSGDAVIEVLKREHVDVVVTDLDMPDGDGFTLNTVIKKKYPKVKVLVISSYSCLDKIGKLIKNDVDGYLIKNSDPDVLLEAVYQVHAGEKYFSEEVMTKYTKSIFSDDSEHKDCAHLTKRETEIIRLVAAEYNTVEIAKKLFISEHTVNTHRKNMLSKLSVKNTAGLVKYALINGLN